MKYPYLGKKDTTRLCAFAARATGHPRRQPSDSVSDCRQFLFRVPTSRQTECGCHGAPVSAINRNRNNTLTSILITESVLFNCRLLTSQNLTTSKSSSGFNFFVSPGGASLVSLRWGPISVVQDTHHTFRVGRFVLTLPPPSEPRSIPDRDPYFSLSDSYVIHIPQSHVSRNNKCRLAFETGLPQDVHRRRQAPPPPTLDAPPHMPRTQR